MLPSTCYPAFTQTHLPRSFGSQFVSWALEKARQEAAWACLQTVAATHCQAAIQLQLGAQGQLLRWPGGKEAEVLAATACCKISSTSDPSPYLAKEGSIAEVPLMADTAVRELLLLLLLLVLLLLLLLLLPGDAAI